MENVFFQVLNQSALQSTHEVYETLYQVHVSAHPHGMHHALGRAGGPRRVHDEERVSKGNLLKLQGCPLVVLHKVLIQHTAGKVLVRANLNVVGSNKIYTNLKVNGVSSLASIQRTLTSLEWLSSGCPLCHRRSRARPSSGLAVPPPLAAASSCGRAPCCCNALLPLRR